jgi:hypothetical protein
LPKHSLEWLQASAQTLTPAVMRLNLREIFEARCGYLDDGLYNHVLELALDDQKQYVKLTDEEVKMLLDPAAYPPNSAETGRIDEMRERLLETMAIIAHIVERRKLRK